MGLDVGLRTSGVRVCVDLFSFVLILSTSVLGIADGNNEDPFDDPDLLAFRENTDYLRENTQHWKASVN